MVKDEHIKFFKEASEDIRRFYQDNNLDRIISAEERSHAIFDAKTRNRPIKRHVDAIYRVRVGGFKDKEHMYFTETHTGKDLRGNTIQKFLINGKYEKPIGQYQWDESSNTDVCTGISHMETTYQIPFDIKMLDDMVESGEIDGRTLLYVGSPTARIYGGIEWDDFRNMSFDDIMGFARTGSRPEDKESKQKDKKRETVG